MVDDVRRIAVLRANGVGDLIVSRNIYRIDEAKHQVEIHSIRHRRDSYRT
jgi:hypothetical protein